MHGSGKYSLTDLNNNTSHVSSFGIITSEDSVSFFHITVTNLIALPASSVTVVEDRPILSAEYHLPLLAKTDTPCSMSLCES